MPCKVKGLNWFSALVLDNMQSASDLRLSISSSNNSSHKESHDTIDRCSIFPEPVDVKMASTQPVESSTCFHLPLQVIPCTFDGLSTGPPITPTSFTPLTASSLFNDTPINSVNPSSSVSVHEAITNVKLVIMILIRSFDSLCSL